MADTTRPRETAIVHSRNKDESQRDNVFRHGYYGTTDAAFQYWHERKRAD